MPRWCQSLLGWCHSLAQRSWFFIHPSAVMLSVIDRLQSPWFSLLLMILIHGVITAAINLSKLFVAQHFRSLGTLNHHACPLGCCGRQGRQGRSRNNKRDWESGKQVSSCLFHFLPYQKSIASILSPSRTCWQYLWSSCSKQAHASSDLRWLRKW